MSFKTSTESSLKNSLNLFKRLKQSALWPFDFGPSCWISLSPNRIAIHQSNDLAPVDVHLPPANASWDWTSALNASKSFLLEAKVQKRSVRVILSDHWVRCFAMALPKGLRSDEDIQQFVRSEFKSRFEEDPAHWCMDWTLVGTSILAMACPQALIKRLRDDLSSIQCKLNFLSGHSLEIFRDRYGQMPGDRWLAFISHDSLSLACLHEGQLKGYWTHAHLDPDVNELATRLERHHRLMPTAQKKIDVVDPQKILDSKNLMNVLHHSGWHVHSNPSFEKIKAQGSLLTWPQFVGCAFS